ncbi:thiamine phosphate synthase [Echinicola rosea]|uniref:Thiamine-phosphate synthase n=1 Tax=Echinicola rosea TaxID=1807691 RepID=A0ABQ1V5J7_9BACT|nr:thiamine phosphate synthase [Echinicola rosea]GGF39307.1 thiamine-phosphate synthase [Echinicola rosea]
MSKISSLHYITPNLDHPKDYLDAIHSYCEAGGKWVQLRMKAFPKAVILRTAFGAKEICDEFGCSLIINDHPEIAHKSGAFGVHVGKKDKAVQDIRERYGSRLVIGATANTLEDILAVANDADYIGLGPFRFTSTKKDLSPTLGITGYQSIIPKVKNVYPALPIIGIGGIVTEDFPSLKASGLSGVAVSGLLHQSNHPQELIKEIQNTFDYVDYRQ